MEVVASLSQGRTAAAQCGLFTHKSVPVIFEPPCTLQQTKYVPSHTGGTRFVEALHYIPEGGGFDSRWGKWKSSFT